MNLKLSFSWVGFAVFMLPMLINIVYAVFPPTGKPEQGETVTRWIEIAFGESEAGSIPGCLVLACRSVFDPVLCRMDPLFCGRARDCLAESRVSFCPDAACGVSRAVLYVCCRLAA